MKRERSDDPLAPMRRFAKPVRNGALQPDVFLCRQLRTKTLYVPETLAERDAGRPTPAAQYWCLKTMRSDGPDGGLVLPEDCTEERICFEPSIGKVHEDS
ncbi:MAG: hypothetical protein ABI592_11025 [Acidobacteriota bacterium]